MMRSAAGHAEDLQVVYGVGGERRIGRRARSTDSRATAGSTPVRIGNAASSQRPARRLRGARQPDLALAPPRPFARRRRLALPGLADRPGGRAVGREPDRGIWEWSGEPEHFVHSKVLCWSALDRGIRLADECMRRAPTRRWTQARDELRRDDRGRAAMTQTGASTSRPSAVPSSTPRCCCCRQSSIVDVGRRADACARWRRCAKSCRRRRPAVPLPAQGRPAGPGGGVSVLLVLAGRVPGPGRGDRRCPRGLRPGAGPSQRPAACSPRRSIRAPASCWATSPRGSPTWLISMPRWRWRRPRSSGEPRRLLEPRYVRAVTRGS